MGGQSKIRQNQWRTVNGTLEVVHKGENQSESGYSRVRRPQGDERTQQGKQNGIQKYREQERVSVFRSPCPHVVKRPGCNAFHTQRNDNAHNGADSDKQGSAQP